MKIKRFEELECWQEARKLVKQVYLIVNANEKFKRDYELCNQIKAAAISTMSNIAEGFSRNSKKEFARFLFISKSSSAEIQSILYAAFDQEYINQKIFDDIYSQADKMSRICSGLIKYLSS